MWLSLSACVVTNAVVRPWTDYEMMGPWAQTCKRPLPTSPTEQHIQTKVAVV